MNWDQISGQWRQVKGKVKEKWGKLTDDEIDVAAGKRDQLVGKIQQKYGIAKDQAEREVDQWARPSGKIELGPIRYWRTEGLKLNPRFT